MPKLCRVDIKHSEEVYKKLDDFIRLLKGRFSIQAIYLFGSFAKREIHEGSDIDLVIVGDFKERFIDRIGRITALTDLPIEPLVYTPQEIEKMINNGNSFIKTVVESGVKLS